MKQLFSIISTIILILSIIVFVKWCSSPDGTGLKRTVEFLWEGGTK